VPKRAIPYREGQPSSRKGARARRESCSVPGGRKKEEEEWRRRRGFAIGNTSGTCKCVQGVSVGAVTINTPKVRLKLEYLGNNPSSATS